MSDEHRQSTSRAHNSAEWSQPPGWRHALFGVPLPPRARRLLISELEGELEGVALEELKLLPLPLMFSPLLDLGLCQEAHLHALKLAAERALERSVAFRLSAQHVNITPLDEHRSLLTLSLTDRHRQLEQLQQDISAPLSRWGFELEGPRVKKNELLLGECKRIEKKSFSLNKRLSFWVDEIFLCLRPHNFSLLRGYERVWASKLPSERAPQPIKSERHSQDATSPELSAQARAERLHERLEQRLQERAEAYKAHTLTKPLSRPSPSPSTSSDIQERSPSSSQPKRRRRGRPQSRSR